ncbi:MAG: hypothetical protein ACRYGP_26930 [Janthinobacterium lividum]
MFKRNAAHRGRRKWRLRIRIRRQRRVSNVPGLDFHARAVDMESAAVAHVATQNKVPFVVFRSLSDLAGGSAVANEMGAFGDLASENGASVLLEFLRRMTARDVGDVGSNAEKH